MKIVKNEPKNVQGLDHVQPKHRVWLEEALKKTSLYDCSSMLLHAHHLEHLLHTQFPGEKRFSILGCESLIVALETLVQCWEKRGISNGIMGMSHRGRLCVLSLIFQKSFQEICDMFFETPPMSDVKYHQGCRINRGKLLLKLLPNPSHLGFITPVVLGYIRGSTHSRGVVVHGDAAFAGQGILYESLQLSNLDGYKSSGTIHIIVDNQIGFTTTPLEYQSTNQCSDLAKAFSIPIIYVNNNDPKDVGHLIEIAEEFCETFQNDILIHLKGFRKYGHNEGDDPTFTQPLLYKKKESAPLQPPQKPLTSNECVPIEKHLEKLDLMPVDLARLQQQLSSVPSFFRIHKKLKKILDARLLSVQNDSGIDFATAEQLAFAVLLNSGLSIRLSGQDSVRGTFSQRHAIWIDQETEARYNPLSQFQGTFEIYNSPLSEASVLGFEYGYSCAKPYSLTIWEAQFGDFSNAAQVIIDQFINSGFQKWNQISNLILLLPHGYEGQGPEHSSARIERFLQMSAQGNWHITVPTTPSQYFHLLKNQYKKLRPLIIFTPKSILRLKESFLKEFEDNASFQPLLVDYPITLIKTVVVCFGKFYYEIKKALQPFLDILIVRLEQLYPLPDLTFILEYNPKTFIFIQEEPKNMGALSYLMPYLYQLSEKWVIIARQMSSSPATGSLKRHKEEQNHLITKILEVL